MTAPLPGDCVCVRVAVTDFGQPQLLLLGGCSSGWLAVAFVMAAWHTALVHALFADLTPGSLPFCPSCVHPSCDLRLC